ncbi:MAG TPA: hypothetical protein IGR64_17140 [Leptolyngbyaceae cyanobacterium M65_K2018_010]|nr:hypothetical protein [Leptolyngbyaceae cyanobacterium M65_K2018_010]
MPWRSWAMKTFKTVAMIQHPRAIVWQTLRDRLDQLAPLLDDIEAVKTQSRERGPQGLHLVNGWQAKVPLPKGLTQWIPPDRIAWTDYADWYDQTWECHWQIEPHVFRDRIHCVGLTRYEEVLAGRGTRLTCQGTLKVLDLPVPGASALIESFITRLIPRNFQQLAAAVSQSLEATEAG